MFLFCVILFYCVNIILGEVYNYVVPEFLYGCTYSFLSSIKRKGIKEKSVKHKPTSMRVIVFITQKCTLR